MSEFDPGVECTPSQLKAIRSLHERVLAHHGEGFEYKRFEVHPFTSNRAIEVFIEVGKVEETGMDAIFNRDVRQVFIGERGGCELVNPADPEKKGKIKKLDECVTEPTLS